MDGAAASPRRGISLRCGNPGHKLGQCDKKNSSGDSLGWKAQGSGHWPQGRCYFKLDFRRRVIFMSKCSKRVLSMTHMVSLSRPVKGEQMMTAVPTLITVRYIGPITMWVQLSQFQYTYTHTHIYVYISCHFGRKVVKIYLVHAESKVQHTATSTRACPRSPRAP